MGRAVFTGRITLSGHVLPKIDPLMIAQGRTTIALLFLAPILLLRNRSALHVRGSHLLQFLPLGILGLAASNYFYYLAIERTSVATAIVLQYVAPVWVLLYMVARNLQRPTLQRVLGVLLAVVGCAFAVGVLSGRASFPWLGSVRRSLQLDRSACSGASGCLVRVLQHLCPAPAPDLFAMDGSRLRAALVGRVLDHRESAVEDCRAALQRRPMAVLGDVFDDVDADPVFLLLHRTTAP